MQINMRREPRRIGRQTYTLCWQALDGSTCSAEARGVDLSRSGIRVSVPERVPPETIVFIQANGGTLAGYGVVRHCTSHGDGYAIGIAFNEETKATVSFANEADIEAARKLLERSEHNCLVSNSLKAKFSLQTDVRVAS